MKKYSSMEKSEVSVNGLPVMVSTSCRVMFRQSNSDFELMDNRMLNDLIAKSFAGSKVVRFFRPQSKELGAMGEIRTKGNITFTSIKYQNHYRILVVKGNVSSEKKADVELIRNRFFVKHASVDNYIEKDPDYYYIEDV